MGFQSTVEFTVRKGEEMLPDFLTKVREAELPLRQFGREGGVYTGMVPASQYGKLSRAAKQCGVLLRVKRRKGAVNRAARYRKRLGVLAGTALFFAILIGSQYFLWQIDVTPVESVSEEYVLERLAAHGIQRGTFLPTADLEEAAARLRAELPGLAFVALNRIGSRLEVALADGVDPPVMEREDGLCNLVAKKAGIVRSVSDLSGQQMVNPGQSVAEGELLVSGIIENRDGNMLYVRANGSVMAETQERRTFTIPLIHTEQKETGRTETKWRVDLFGKKWPLFLAVPEEELYFSRTEWVTPQIGGFYLPFGLEKETRHFYTEETVHFSEEEAVSLLQKMADSYEEELAEHGEVVRRSEETALLEDGIMQLSVCWDIVEDIALEQPILDEREILEGESSGE